MVIKSATTLTAENKKITIKLKKKKIKYNKQQQKNKRNYTLCCYYIIYSKHINTGK